MGKGSDEILDFIESIPDDKLTGFSEVPGTIHRDINFRLDLQNITSTKPRQYNIQVQVN
ncbi:hypothetical protein B0J18DRAFT_143311 [Chaetomium sp. MPI-SDFR-AT-0129]|nr:hypothetical protein B0J18DRAFT_143311 [Chaetomium sp. MPI-SDFR-AT-0129]